MNQAFVLTASEDFTKKEIALKEHYFFDTIRNVSPAITATLTAVIAIA